MRSLLFLLALAPALPSFAASPADAILDIAAGEVCFPVDVEDGSLYYDVCLVLISDPDLSPPIRFGLASAKAREAGLPGMATYSQEEGAQIPVVRALSGQVFLDARLDASFDASANKYEFTLTGIRNVTPNPRHSVARLWNEALLSGIRRDFARPTVHARNLFHTSAAMYDAWAAYDGNASPYLLGKTVNGFQCGYEGLPVSQEAPAEARRIAISHAAYRLLTHRFQNSPGAAATLTGLRELMLGLDLDPDDDSLDYQSGDPAALGNYIAECVIAYGMQDGANEAGSYTALRYQPVNTALVAADPGNPVMEDPNRWQPLSFAVFRDQSGNIEEAVTPAFVSPEWGSVSPFALREEDLQLKQRNGDDYWVFHTKDVPAPPLLLENDPLQSEYYKWTFALVAMWSSHLDPADEVMWDISPGGIGNLLSLPESGDLEALRQFFNDEEGGVMDGGGYELNPRTGEPYEEQWVPRGDYTRVLAEFWADGPDSETPPGHWFTILNHVSGHPLLEKRLGGMGEELDALEWDIKTYFALGGAMHDSAVAVWGLKGWYDYPRPVSTIRYMAELGQSSNENGPSYHPQGLPLRDGFIEIVGDGDPLAGANGENIGKIKLYAWRGPDFIEDPETDEAGVGWILAQDWWPYQRPTFVSPPFAGYISGHSTFSRAAAEMLTHLTGDPYFPGGIGEFEAPRNEFLVFEEGPSVDITLQWATYRDASDQTSLSRIWGGIHPPVDDIPGRWLGITIGNQAFDLAEEYFTGVQQ